MPPRYTVELGIRFANLLFTGASPKAEVIELCEAKLYHADFEEDSVTLRATPASLASEAFRVLAKSAQALFFLGRT